MITPETLAKSGSEHGHQSALFCQAALHLDLYPTLVWLTAIPNGGLRDKITASKLKAEGVKSGVPDILLPVRRGQYPCLWIELKIPKLKPKRSGSKGGRSDEQIKWGDWLLSQGHGVMTCYGWEEAWKCIVDYLEWK